MSFLAALNLDLEDSMLPASLASWRLQNPKLAGHGVSYGSPMGPTESQSTLGVEFDERSALTGDGFSDWMTERVDFSCFLTAASDPASSLPSAAPNPDLEAMASMLKAELEQMEDYFLEETLSPTAAAAIVITATGSVGTTSDQVAPSTPPSHGSPSPFAYPPSPDLGSPVAPFDAVLPESTASCQLETLDSGGLELLSLCSVGPPTPHQGHPNEMGYLPDDYDNPQCRLGVPRSSRPSPYDRPLSPACDTAAAGAPSHSQAPPPEGDKRRKKRDQNKTAALRYRQRKRAEYEAHTEECDGLEARNRELKEKAESIEREIQYVKDLLIEVYKARSQRLNKN
uniref:Activating transcription factor 5 n=1 Tax=Latimeria chalumnae TaxID=7897 RepID=H3AJP8_LATCH